MKKKLIVELEDRLNKAAQRLEATQNAQEQAFLRGVIITCEGLLEGIRRGLLG